MIDSWEENERFRNGGMMMGNGHYSTLEPSVDLNAHYDRLGADLDAPPRPPVPPTNRLDAIRVWTAHASAYLPLCHHCRRPYNPDARIQQGIVIGCYQCSPLDPESLAVWLKRQLDVELELRKCQEGEP